MYISNKKVPYTNTFVCVFDLVQFPKVVYKINHKVPASILRKMYTRIIVYLNNFLMIGNNAEETIISRDIVIFLLQNLGFFINLKISILHSKQRIEFLQMMIDLVEMTVSLPQEKVESISKRCQDIYPMQVVSIKVQVTLFRTISSTGSATFSAPPCMRYVHRQQIHNIFLKRDYNSKVVLDPFCTGQLNWWISNLRLLNGRSVISHQVGKVRCIKYKLRGDGFVRIHQ